MKERSARFIPLVVTVGQVAIFPYYIIWLKEVSLTFALFAWLFAAFSFAAAWGYSVYQSKNNKRDSLIPFILAGMGITYLFAGSMQRSFEYLPYAAILIQISLGFLQGYFRAWHSERDDYRFHAVQHYVIVGVAMIGLSFIRVISPAFFIIAFGIVLCICGFGYYFALKPKNRED